MIGRHRIAVKESIAPVHAGTRAWLHTTLLAIVTLLLCAGFCSADIILLKNGFSVKGDILKKDEDKVVLKVPYGTMTFATNEIERIEYSGTEQSAAAEEGAPLDAAPEAGEETAGAPEQSEFAIPRFPVTLPPGMENLQNKYLKMALKMQKPVSLLTSLISLGISLGLYIFFAYCLKRICVKAGSEPGVLIWIPLLQLFPLLKAAGMSYWMFILLLIPLVNLIIAILVWVNICNARGKTPLLVIALFLPVLNIITILYLAFSE